MVIDKIGNINNIIESKKTKASSQTKDVKKPNDSLQISSEGKMAAEVSRATQIVKETPDMRIDRVNDIKERVQNGTYNFDDDSMLERVADKIAQHLLK